MPKPQRRLLAFFGNFPPEGGSASRRNAEMLRSVMDRVRPNTVQVVYFDLVGDTTGSYFLPELGSASVMRIAKSKSFLPWSGFPWFNPAASVYFLAIGLVWLLRVRPTVVLIAVPPYPLAPVATLARVLGARGIMVDAHDALGRTIQFAAKSRGLPWTLLVPFADLLVRWGAFLGLSAATVVSSVYAVDPVTDLPRRHLGTKWVYVPNGVDFRLYDSVRNAPFNEARRNEADKNQGPRARLFIHAGGLGGYYVPELAIPPLSAIASRDCHIVLVLVGGGKPDLKATRPSDRSPDFELQLTGPLSREETLRWMLDANFGLYAITAGFPDQGRALGVKALDYLACGLPILVIAPPENAVARLVSEFGLGVCARSSSGPDITMAVQRILGEEEVLRANVLRFQSRLRVEYDLQQNLSRASDALARRL